MNCSQQWNMKTRLWLLSVMAVLVLSFGSLQARSDTGPIRPARDLGEEVMKPMAKLFKSVGTTIQDGNKNSVNLQALSEIGALIDIAIITTPPTKAYKAEVALVGAGNATLKYQSLLKVLKIDVLELSAVLRTKTTQVCGKGCDSILGQMKEASDLGHATFKDDDDLTERAQSAKSGATD